MEGVLGIVFNAENVRMLVLLAFGFCAYVLMKGQMKDLEASLNKRIDGVEASLNKRIDGVDASLNKRIDSLENSIGAKIDERLVAFHALLKANDFAHLNSTIEALTFTLEKNGFLKREDKEYIDGRLDK
jgi:hypothetical protein